MFSCPSSRGRVSLPPPLISSSGCYGCRQYPKISVFVVLFKLRLLFCEGDGRVFAEFCAPLVLLILSFVLNLSGGSKWRLSWTSPIYFLCEHLVALMQKSHLP